MFKNKKATSIVEIMVMMLILVLGIVGMYKVYYESYNLSESTKNKIKAIQIGREGIEAMKNIRDTNWLLFEVSTQNCWNVKDYNVDCATNTEDNYTKYDLKQNTIYALTRDSYNRWTLSKRTQNKDFKDTTHRSDYKIGLDSNGLYTQSGGIVLKPIFTRYIKVEYLDDGIMSDLEISQGHKNDLSNPDEASNEEKMKISSVVQWADNTSSKPHKVEFTTILTNWKD